MDTGSSGDAANPSTGSGGKDQYRALWAAHRRLEGKMDALAHSTTERLDAVLQNQVAMMQTFVRQGQMTKTDIPPQPSQKSLSLLKKLLSTEKLRLYIVLLALLLGLVSMGVNLNPLLQAVVKWLGVAL